MRDEKKMTALKGPNHWRDQPWVGDAALRPQKEKLRETDEDDPI
jgi:hypothetical protein